VKPRWSDTGRKALAMTATLAAVLATLVGAARAGANTFDYADTPDPFVLLHSGRYYAYSTGANVRRCDGSYQRMYVPHRSTTTLRNWGTPSSPACFSDVMSGGPGSWAEQTTFLVWAPTVYRNPDNGRFVLLFAAQRAGSSQQMCIGRAESASPGGGFVADPGPLICPSNGTPAIDPNALVSDSTHNVYLQWRQDTSPPESRLYSARYSHDGRTRLTDARNLLSDPQITWDGGTIENPAVDFHNGTWYLFFSGNFWGSGNYATGLAACGRYLTTGGKCSVLYPASRPWLGWSGRSGGKPIVTTTEDLPGPGGMSFVTRSTGGLVRASDGSPYIAIHHWLWPGFRALAMYKLVYTLFGPIPGDY
jgi:hypothetical protein